MPTLSEHQSSRSTKLLLIGDSGTGKTGALTSLLKQGYRLRIFDFDNGLDSLVAHARRECPDALANVEYETLRDRITGYAGDRPTFKDVPDAFSRTMKLLDKWTDGTKPAEWDERTIVVIDSLTMMADAAFNWVRALNSGVKDPRQWFFSAQNATETTLAMLTGEAFRPNVIVIAHIQYQIRQDGSMKGYPVAIGSALGPTIPAYFNNVALAQTTGTGDKVQRTIQTAPTALIDLKNPASFAMAPTLPLATGLAEFFAAVRGEKK